MQLQQTVSPKDLDPRLKAAQDGDDRAQELLRGSPARVRSRRQRRQRRALFDVSVAGVGWASVAPIEIEGTTLWRRAVDGFLFRVHSGEKADVTVRPPMLPFDASGTRPADWSTRGDAVDMASQLFDKSKFRQNKKNDKKGGGWKHGSQGKNKKKGKKLPPWMRRTPSKRGGGGGDKPDQSGWEVDGSW